ncbi:MAG: hypothetical protein WBK20_12890 [Spirochaetota bacterium]
MRTLLLIISILFFLVLWHAAYATYYPFILHVNPVICKNCTHTPDFILSRLVQKLYASDIFAGSNTYQLPVADNTPSINELTRILSLTITTQRTITYKELTPYLKEKNEYTTYTLIVTIDSSSNPAEFTSRYETTPQQLEQTIESIAYDIIAFYSSRRIPVIYKTPFVLSMNSINLSPSYIKPLKNIQQYSDSGAGFQISAYITTSKFPGLSFIPSLSWFTLTNTVATIKYWHSIGILLSTGYTIHLPLRLSLTPYIGAGYLFQFINGDTTHYFPPYTYSLSTYYNPQCAAGIIVSFQLDPLLYVFITPSYTTFFESSHQSSYISYAFGFAFPCTFTLYSSQ